MNDLKLLHRLLLTFLWLAFIVGPTDNAAGASGKKQITIVFRFDDFSGVSPTAFETQLLDLFKRHNAVSTFGVVPYAVRVQVDARPQTKIPLTSTKAEILRQAIATGIVEVALHDDSHQRRVEGIWNEFSGLSVSSQIQ